jgi:hypothetical protein
MDKQAIYTRALKHHSPKGRVIKALDKVFGATYPAGTNLVLEFLKEFIGMRYGHVDACMDKVTDCAELWRVTFYIWFGIDIGNYSDAEYKHGTFVTKIFKFLPACRPLDLVFYDTSSKKITGHVAGIFDTKRIFQSGAASNHSRVNFSPIFWLPKGKTSACFRGVKRYLTDEQYNSVIVGEVKKETEESEIMLKQGDKGQAVYNFQHACLRAGCSPLKKGEKWKDWKTGEINGCDAEFGEYMVTVVKGIQANHNLPQSGTVDALTYGCLVSDIPAADPANKGTMQAEIDLLKKENENLLGKITAKDNVLDNIIGSTDSIRGMAQGAKG